MFVLEDLGIVLYQGHRSCRRLRGVFKQRHGDTDSKLQAAKVIWSLESSFFSLALRGDTTVDETRRCHLFFRPTLSVSI